MVPPGNYRYGTGMFFRFIFLIHSWKTIIPNLGGLELVRANVCFSLRTIGLTHSQFKILFSFAKQSNDRNYMKQVFWFARLPVVYSINKSCYASKSWSATSPYERVVYLDYPIISLRHSLHSLNFQTPSASKKSNRINQSHRSRQQSRHTETEKDTKPNPQQQC